MKKDFLEGLILKTQIKDFYRVVEAEGGHEDILESLKIAYALADGKISAEEAYRLNKKNMTKEDELAFELMKGGIYPWI